METTEERRFREARERYARGAEHLRLPDELEVHTDDDDDEHNVVVAT